ncbi:endonuclease/exonuclease/phosphatase family protein [Roseibium algae]|uniref:Endonuclease/exonuclease/phosphatase family protein n=1 Tax=Roseibium algae TaxID=3123038 RepID=A0ABU8TES2_9HYPH
MSHSSPPDETGQQTPSAGNPRQQPLLSRWISLSGWMGLIGGIAVSLLALSAFIAPNFWFTDNMSFFQRQFLGAGICGFIGGLAGLTVPHRLPLLYRKILVVLLVFLVTVGGLMMARIATVSKPMDETQHLNEPGRKSIRVVSINLERLFLADGGLASYLAEVRPDVIIVEEVAWRWQEERRRRQLDNTQLTGYRAYPSQLAVGELGDIAIFSRFPILRNEPILVPGEAEGTSEAAREIMSLTLDVDGTPLNLLAVHPASPRSKPRWQDRQTYLQTLTSEVSRLQKTETNNTLVIGDWNLSPWSGHFLKFLTDQNMSTAFPGGFPQTTRFFFDYRLHWLLGAVVDHFAVSPGIDILNVSLGPDIRSDHLPLVVDLALSDTTKAPVIQPESEAGRASGNTSGN